MENFGLFLSCLSLIFSCVLFLINRGIFQRIKRLKETENNIVSSISSLELGRTVLRVEIQEVRLDILRILDHFQLEKYQKDEFTIPVIIEKGKTQVVLSRKTK